MCSVALLTAASVGMQAYGQYQQGKAQSDAYEAQAAAADQNAAIEARKREQIADQYAQKQLELNDKMKLARGRINAAAGASGLMGGVGSSGDLLDSSQEAFEKDTQNLLYNQRNDTWNSWVNQVNYMNAASAARASAYNAKQSGKAAAIGTLLNGAASFYGGGSTKTTAKNGGSAWYDQGAQNILNTGSGFANVGSGGFDLVSGEYIGSNPLLKSTKKKYNLNFGGLNYGG